MERESCVTLKQRADFPPAGDAPFAGELAQGRLQEKDGDPAAHEEDDVGDEERSLMRTKGERKSSIIFLHHICSQLTVSATQSRFSVITSYSKVSISEEAYLLRFCSTGRETSTRCPAR